MYSFTRTGFFSSFLILMLRNTLKCRVCYPHRGGHVAIIRMSLIPRTLFIFPKPCPPIARSPGISDMVLKEA